MFPYADSTMWGPQGDPNKPRKRLKPGDRMADGRIFMGNDPAAVLEAQLERVLLQMKPLEAQRDELLVKLAEVAPEKYGSKAAPAKAAPKSQEAASAATPVPPSRGETTPAATKKPAAAKSKAKDA